MHLAKSQRISTLKDHFAQIIIERPRRGSRNRNPKHGFSVHDPDPEAEYDHLPKQEGILPFRRRKGQGKFDRKDFSDLLGPIQGYLRSRIGKPWDKTFSEIKNTMRSWTIPVQHVIDTHILPQVEQNVRFIMKGKKKVPINPKGYELYNEFYIHPKTGNLCWAQAKEAYRARWKRIEKEWTNSAGYKWVKKFPHDKFNFDVQEFERGELLKVSETIYIARINDSWILHEYGQKERIEPSDNICVCNHSLHQHIDYSVIPKIRSRCRNSGCGCKSFAGSLRDGRKRTWFDLISKKVLSKKAAKEYGLD